jgi:NTP pyrophosphatase (non-canonical NTP hydrolase)
MQNFPDCTVEDQFMGMVEEVGEIAHAMLKGKQGIRIEDDIAASAKIRDGVADLTIYMMGLCSLMGWRFEELVTSVATNEVMQRDWIKFPMNGVTE